MTHPSLVVARKTLRDFSSVKLLVAYFLPYTAIAALVANGLLSSRDRDIGSLPLATQEQILTEAFSQLSFTWAIGIPAMVLVAVLVANGIAKDEQEGTLRILLSKPIRRREVLAGKFVAVMVFGTLSMIAGSFIVAGAVYAFSGASALALGGSVFALLPGNVVYAVLVSVVVAAIGTFFAVLTGSRLKTVLATLLVPALFFGFLFTRVITGGAGSYTRFRLYLVDGNYHLGNAYVLLQRAAGVEFSPPTQAALGLQTGVYEASGWGPNPLVGGSATSIPLTGYVPAPASVVLLVVGSVILMATAVYRFERKDIS